MNITVDIIKDILGKAVFAVGVLSRTKNPIGFCYGTRSKDMTFIINYSPRVIPTLEGIMSGFRTG